MLLILVLDEELGDFSLFEDEELRDGAKSFKFFPDQVSGYLKNYRIIDADKQDAGRLLALALILSLPLTGQAHQDYSNYF